MFLDRPILFTPKARVLVSTMPLRTGLFGILLARDRMHGCDRNCLDDPLLN